jgi:cobyrinic acid a,c-diamide synthase
VTLALLVALRRRGLRIAAAKAGPDYIDPAFHARALGRESVNLDSWAMAPALLDHLVAEAGGDADLIVVEAAMGLFDGVGAASGRTGSAADLAARYGWPVLLVLDVSGQSQSAAAVAQGFANFRPGVQVAGVVLNRVASPRHLQGVAASLEAAGVRRLGAVFRDDGLLMPERHLGLVQACEDGGLDARLERLGDMAQASLDLHAIVGSARAGRSEPAPLLPPPLLPPPGQRIALARDAAFSFVYPHMVAGWRRAGAEITPFSPLANESPPDGCDSCWLPGGYPELHAPQLSGSGRFLAGLRRFAEAGRPVHGECGGYMVLGRTLQTADGRTWPMADLLSHRTSFAKRRLSLGYRAATLLADGALGRRGERLRGHEFHHSTLAEGGGDAPLLEVRDAGGAPLGALGQRRGAVSGAYLHLISREDP